MPWEPGQSGNPGGNTRDRQVTEALRLEALAILKSGKDKGKSKLRVAARKVVDRAMEGDLGSFQVLADRLEGKPNQQIDGKVELGASQLFLEILRAMNPQADEPKVIEHEQVE